MQTAKFYIYRNLHTGGFSVKYRGKVVDRLFTITAEGVTFKVNQLGRMRVIREKRKNVHAYVVCDKYYPYVYGTEEVDKLGRISYNPYKLGDFTVDGKVITSAEKVLLQNGVCYLAE